MIIESGKRTNQSHFSLYWIICNCVLFTNFAVPHNCAITFSPYHYRLLLIVYLGEENMCKLCASMCEGQADLIRSVCTEPYSTEMP